MSADTSLVKPKLDSTVDCIGPLLLARAEKQARRTRAAELFVVRND